MSISKCVLPAEWQPQSAVLLTWPHAHSDWRPWLAAVDHTFTLLSTEISRRQAVIIACYDATHRDHIQALLRATGAVVERIRLYCVPSNDAWVRDHGPITVYQDGVPVLLDFRFNGWGGKYVHELDNQVTARLHSLGAFGTTPVQAVDLILEGGSIESDGQGTLLTTSQCLLTPTRNDLPREVLEQRLRELLGIERFLWLNQGHLSGDDTDSHIDILARFCDPGTIAYQSCTDSTDDDYKSLQAMEQELRTFRTPAGEPYRLVPLPWPRPHYNEEGRRLPAGYANFLIINNAVLVPTYDDSADAQALVCLRTCFPGREVIGIPSLPLIQQYGSLHCATMQLPVGIL